MQRGSYCAMWWSLTVTDAGVCNQKRIIYTAGSWIRKKVMMEGRDMMEGVRFRRDSWWKEECAQKKERKKEKEEHSQAGEAVVGVWRSWNALVCSRSDSVWPCGLPPTRLLLPGDSPGKNAAVGCHALLQGSSRPRDQTHTSCISCTGRQVLYHQCHLWDAVSFLKIEQLLAFESYTVSQCTHLTTC